MKPSLHLEKSVDHVATTEVRRGIHIVSESSTSTVRFFADDRSEEGVEPGQVNRFKSVSPNLGSSPLVTG